MMSAYVVVMALRIGVRTTGGIRSAALPAHDLRRRARRC